MVDYFDRVDNAGSKNDCRGDISVRIDGVLYILDTTIIAPPPTHSMSLATTGQHLQKAQAEKCLWYTKQFNIPETQVVPFAFDQYGRLCESGILFIKLIAHNVSGGNNIKYSHLVRRYYEVLSISLQRALGSQVNGYSNSYNKILLDQKRKLEEQKNNIGNRSGRRASSGSG
jgi:hypothetical protein